MFTSGLGDVITAVRSSPGLSVGLDERTMHIVWRGLCAMIEDTLKKGKGVNVPDFATFTFKKQVAHIGTWGTRTTTVPVLILQPAFCSRYGLQSAKTVALSNTRAVNVVLLNYASIGVGASLSKEIVTNSLKDIFRKIGELAHEGTGLGIDMGFCRLLIRGNRYAASWGDGLLSAIAALDNAVNHQAVHVTGADKQKHAEAAAGMSIRQADIDQLALLRQQLKEASEVGAAHTRGVGNASQQQGKQSSGKQSQRHRQHIAAAQTAAAPPPRPTSPTAARLKAAAVGDTFEASMARAHEWVGAVLEPNSGRSHQKPHPPKTRDLVFEKAPSMVSGMGNTNADGTPQRVVPKPPPPPPIVDLPVGVEAAQSSPGFSAAGGAAGVTRRQQRKNQQLANARALQEQMAQNALRAQAEREEDRRKAEEHYKKCMEDEEVRFQRDRQRRLNARAIGAENAQTARKAPAGDLPPRAQPMGLLFDGWSPQQVPPDLAFLRQQIEEKKRAAQEKRQNDMEGQRQRELQDQAAHRAQQARDRQAKLDKQQQAEQAYVEAIEEKTKTCTPQDSSSMRGSLGGLAARAAPPTTNDLGFATLPGGNPNKQETGRADQRLRMREMMKKNQELDAQHKTERQERKEKQNAEDRAWADAQRAQAVADANQQKMLKMEKQRQIKMMWDEQLERQQALKEKEKQDKTGTTTRNYFREEEE